MLWSITAQFGRILTDRFNDSNQFYKIWLSSLIYGCIKERSKKKNMRAIKNSGTKIERLLGKALWVKEYIFI